MRIRPFEYIRYEYGVYLIYLNRSIRSIQIKYIRIWAIFAYMQIYANLFDLFDLFDLFEYIFAKIEWFYANIYKFMQIFHIFAYIRFMRIYANHANLCESFDIKYIRITSLCESFESNIFDRNRLFHIRIYSLCKYMRIYSKNWMHANLCEFVTMLISNQASML